jgi:hypothetical protein
LAVLVGAWLFPAHLCALRHASGSATLTRKNALFAGHDDGAENCAILASLIETAKLSGIDPQAWLADILACLVNLWPNNRLDELLPWNWAAAHQLQQRAA